MSAVVRLSEEADEYICNNQQDEETYKEAADRLLGIKETENDYITKTEAEDLIEKKIEQRQHQTY